ncbi:MAG: hypothetical protein QNJ58_26345 [Desulfobacterales bacterium]|nr:hypothetical protein [Desulfobacterales bacterium]
MPTTPIPSPTSVVRMKFDPGVLMYLIIIDRHLLKYKDLFKVRPTEKFNDMVHELVVRHMSEEKAFSGPVFNALANISDDMLAGREVVIRAGDYIALMEYGRKKKLI